MPAPDWKINHATGRFDSNRVLHTAVHHRIQGIDKSRAATPPVVNG